MPAATLDIILEQGSTFQRTLTLKDSNGDPLNLTGFLARSSIRKKIKDDLALASFVLTLGSPATSGVVNWTMSATASASIPAALTSGFEPSNYFYDMEVESPSGVVTRILQGSVKLIPNVTRP